jgi:hypothetical protein
MPLFMRSRTNPIFYADRLATLLRDEPERLERMRTDPDSLDLLTWNVFSSLDSHRDQDWLAYRLQALGGGRLRAPVRISLFSGAVRTPYLEPSASYLREIRRRSGVSDGERDGVAIFAQPVEVPVRVETPDVLLLIDVGHNRLRAGVGGRDRLAELIDTGLEHGRRLSSSLAIGVIADPHSDVLAAQVPRLADRSAVARVVPWRDTVPPVEISGMTWPDLLALWDDERDELDLAGQPVRDFRSYAQRATH